MSSRRAEGEGEAAADFPRWSRQPDSCSDHDLSPGRCPPPPPPRRIFKGNSYKPAFNSETGLDILVSSGLVSFGEVCLFKVLSWIINCSDNWQRNSCTAALCVP